MPLELTNTTTFTAKQLPLTAPNGAGIMRLVVKATYSIQPGGKLELADEQADIQQEDEYWGDEGLTALRRESDIALNKPFTDLLVLGHAWAPLGRATTHVDVGLTYNEQFLTRLRVSGDRRWFNRGARWTLTAPEAFERMPLSYDLAFGGFDEAGCEQRNKVGRGYASKLDNDFQGKFAPNIERLNEQVKTPKDRPEPGGLGILSRDWSPRLGFAGTYDQRWLDDQFPLLPVDFDSRFNQTVPKSQWLESPRAGDRISVLGMHPDGTIHCELPNPVLHSAFYFANKPVDKQAMKLETIVVDTDTLQVELTWKSTADVHGDPFQLIETVVSRAPTRRPRVAKLT